jgi:hypothetical protein
MRQTHAGYSAIGLGCAELDEMVAAPKADRERGYKSVCVPGAVAALEVLRNTSPLSMYLSCRGACSMMAEVARALLEVSTAVSKGLPLSSATRPALARGWVLASLVRAGWSAMLVEVPLLKTRVAVVGALVIGYAMATIVTTMLYHLHAGAERAVADRRAAAVRAGALPPMEAPHGSAPVRHLRRLAGVGIVLGVALSTMVFVMFPRDSVLGGGQGGARQSGFRPDISLWSGGRVSL